MRSVHPRVCGERVFKMGGKTAENGSSPRVRGTLCRAGRGNFSRRFIPACAGNAGRNADAGRPKPVHPRVCGERPICGAASLFLPGSSPRVRGTRGGASTGIEMARFIPACAGNACLRRSANARRAVHPRVCGERVVPATAVVPAGGSSPRVRGTRTLQSLPQATCRFIPACAGNACRCCHPRYAAAVHPRVCGERLFNELTNQVRAGSSPRVRGTRLPRLGSG